MKFEELVVLLPCHSLDDFPTYYEGEGAEGLLAAWSSLWHPAMLVAASTLPTWHRADSPPDEVSGRLIVIPSVAESQLPAGFAARAEAEGACVIQRQPNRDKIVATALASLDGGDHAVSPELAEDFLALGFGFLQIELLTRRMRYVSHIDEDYFRNQTLAAAESALRDDKSTTHDLLTQCFSMLSEARAHFYPVDSYFVDLTLIAATTIGAELRTQLSDRTRQNLIVSAAVVEKMAGHESETLEMLRQAVDDRRVAIAGGEYEERELPLLTPEAILAELSHGLTQYKRHLGRRPFVFARRRNGLTPVLPQILRKLGFNAALHFTLDDGVFPQSERGKTRWQGLDGSLIDALARIPLDAQNPASFLGLSETLGDSMDHDHVATVCFAHWPGRVSQWYHDLLRMTSYAPVLGKFVTLDDYFANTEASIHYSRFEADEYHSPYLRQAVEYRQPDPISSHVREEQERVTADASQTLQTVTALVQERYVQADEGLYQAINDLAAAISTGSAQARNSNLVLNPFSFSRRIPVEKIGTVDVAGMGFAWAESGTATLDISQRERKKSAPLAVDNNLQNEFLRVVISPQTGGIQSIHDRAHRGNRLSQQLAMRVATSRSGLDDRWEQADDNAAYSKMVSESLLVTNPGPAVGEIVTRGQLIDPVGRKVAGFLQTVQLWSRSRVVLIEIELDPLEELAQDAWNSYYAARFAWANPSASLRRSIHLVSVPTESNRLEAPHFVQITSGETRTAILTGGQPYHRRIGQRMLDSLLIVRGEQQRKFRVGVAVDVPIAVSSALGMSAPISSIKLHTSPSPELRVGWFFHLDARNLIATHWEPLIEEGQVCGFRARLLETQGAGGRAQLMSFRPPGFARLVDLEGNSLGELHVQNDRIHLEFSAYEWLTLEARWRDKE